MIQIDIDSKSVSDGYHTFDELYEHRYALFIALMRWQDDTRLSEVHIWRSKLHHDDTMFKDSFIAGITTPKGVVSYHLPLKYWEDLTGYCNTMQNAPEWDGHTSNDVIQRLLDWY